MYIVKNLNFNKIEITVSFNIFMRNKLSKKNMYLSNKTKKYVTCSNLGKIISILNYK